MTNEERPEPIFCDGLMFQRPHEGAPSFVKGKLSINIKKFMDFARTQRDAGNISAKGWLALDLKESKNTTLYFQVNTWKAPETKKVEEVKQDIRDTLTSKGAEGETINPDDIPF